jgi:Domain of unknown function (DUF5658)
MSTLPPTQDDWSSVRPQHAGRGFERRSRPDRRQRLWWSFFYGSIRPRRRYQGRRTDDGRFQPTDWHGAHLWAVSVSILILSVVDAFLTVTLMSGGAVEVNPVMAAVMGHDIGVFAILKIAMTGACVMLMVFLARYRFMRVVRVELLLYGVLLTYLFLVGHELGMLRMLPDRGFY